MKAYQSDTFRKLPAEAKRAALRSSIAAQYPDSGFSREYEHDGKLYRTLPLSELSVDSDKDRAEKG